MAGCRAENHVFEFSEYVRANGRPFIVGDHPAGGSLAPEHVEVIEPEGRHHFLELAFRVDRPNETGTGHVREDFPVVPFLEFLPEVASLTPRK